MIARTGYDLREGATILAERRRKLIARLAAEALAIIDGKRRHHRDVRHSRAGLLAGDRVSTSVRSVPIDVTQAVTIEEVGKDMLRQGDLRATTLLTVVLQWRSLGRTEPDTFSRRVDSDERTLTVLPGGDAA